VKTKKLPQPQPGIPLENKRIWSPRNKEEEKLLEVELARRIYEYRVRAGVPQESER